MHLDLQPNPQSHANVYLFCLWMYLLGNQVYYPDYWFNIDKASFKMYSSSHASTLHGFTKFEVDGRV